ncbi:MAG: hypothetical protein R3330_18715, partial [Saprospiraceae bacterium]|nr:hypothetical protein [Saprospiraceae bacterium]
MSKIRIGVARFGPADDVQASRTSGLLQRLLVVMICVVIGAVSCRDDRHPYARFEPPGMVADSTGGP